MLDRIDLNLMIGPAVPIPAPREAIEALASVEVVNDATSRASVFTLEFQIPPRSPLLTLLLLTGGSVPPIMRVVLFLTFQGRPVSLIDGVITDQQVTPGAGGGASTLKLFGSDLSTVMNLIEFDGIPYPGMPVFARVALILAKYAALGVIPVVIPTLLTDVDNPLEQIPRQQGTDLEYVEALAEEAGYVFYVEPGPAPATSIAYWGPAIKTGVPQPALNVDMDVNSNVESLNFRFNNEKAAQHVLFIHEKTTKIPIPIPIPNVSLLEPPLGLIPPFPKKLKLLDTSKLSPIRAALFGLAKQAQSNEAVTANGSLNVTRYGNILQARRLVGVRGAGDAFDGLYYVQKVTHNIKRGEYKQSFTLTRNGLVSTVPSVPA